MIFNASLHAANASRSFGFLWHYVQPFVNIFLSDASDTSLKRAVMLVSPYIPRDTHDPQGLVRVWVKTASAIPWGERGRSERCRRTITNRMVWIATAGRP